MRQNLLDQTTDVLHAAGFLTSKRCDVRSRCFDITARRGSILLFLKMLSNIDGLSEDTALELKKLAEYFFGSPLLIGEKARDHELQAGAVYVRYGIPAVNVDTLSDFFIDELPPLIYAAPGGLYVKLDEKALYAARTHMNLSLGAIASELGVSRRSIRKYEEGMDAKVEIAVRLEGLLDAPLAVPINILAPRVCVTKIVRANSLPPVEKEAVSLLLGLGFRVLPLFQAPFEVLSQTEEETLLTGISKNTSLMAKRAELMSSISQVVFARSLYITAEEPKFFRISNTVVVCLEELEQLDSSTELVHLVRERSEN
ncbi:MAG TPA: transcriptional regulator [Candidatus Acidoferrales bacterium]|nr:transcriptional regulator [Candidatus Acidoferrales bacterium]